MVIVPTDENQSIISIQGSFAAVSDIAITNTTISDPIKTSNLPSLQQDSIVNNSSLGEINSSSISYSSSISKIKMPEIIDPTLTVEVVSDGLNMPTTMAFLGPDDFLILQENGSLVRIVDGMISNKTRLDVPVANGFYEGLLGVVLTDIGYNFIY